MEFYFKRWLVHVPYIYLSVCVLIVLGTGYVATATTSFSSFTATDSVSSPRDCGVAGQSNVQRLVSGHSRFRRVVNGLEAGRCRYPWMVLIDRGGSPSDTCGAALISDRHIVTAAHCFDNVRSIPTVVVGEYNRTELRPGSEHRTTKYSVDIHPLYSNVIYRNDIAVVTLETPLDLSQYECLRPICLPEENASLPVGTRCAVAGWGSVQRGRVKNPKVSNVLKTTYINVVEPSKCKTVWSMLFFPGKQICAGDLSGMTDSCGGDSGGPLMCHDEKSQTKVKDKDVHFLFGVVSLGNNDCAKPDVPAMYTDVRKYLPWIKHIMGNNH